MGSQRNDSPYPAYLRSIARHTEQLVETALDVLCHFVGELGKACGTELYMFALIQAFHPNSQTLVRT
jgi:hypothetical protein